MKVVIDIDAKDPSKIVVKEFPKVYRDLFDSIPGFHGKSNGFWYGPFSWQSWLALQATFNMNDCELIVEPALANMLTEMYNTFIAPGMELRQKTDAPGYDALYDYQRAGVEFLSTMERAILADGLGSGKTRTSFSTVRRLYEMGHNPFPVLVVAPNTTKLSWEREIEVVWPGLKVVVVDGTSVQKRKQLNTPGHVYIMNWESVHTFSSFQPYGSMALKRCSECGGFDETVKEAACQVHEKELNRIDFNTVIGDEIHRIMNPASSVARSFKRATGDARFRFGLSGTPLSKDPSDLFSILNWLLPQGYPAKTRFVSRFCLQSFNAWGGNVVIGIKKEMENEFFAGFDPFFRRMPTEVVMKSLPPRVYMRREVEMKGKQKTAYKQMVKQMVAELDDELLVETSPLTKMIRLLQFSSAFAELEIVDFYHKVREEWIKKNKVTLKDPSNKVDAFMEDLDDFGDESVIVFCTSRQLVDILSSHLTKRGVAHGLITGAQNTTERQQAMDDFQAGRTQFILCTIAAGGTGITLTKGSVMVFLQRSWSMIENTQAEGRGYRIGSEIHDQVRVIDYVSTGTVEEGVFEAVAEKGRQLEFILRDKDLLKKLLLENIVETTDELLQQMREENTDEPTNDYDEDDLLNDD